MDRMDNFRSLASGSAYRARRHPKTRVAVTRRSAVTSIDGITSVSAAESHGWIGTETVKTRLGNFEFKGGYPTDDSAQRLADQRAYFRAVEVYLAQMPVVSMYNVWKG